MNRQRPTLNYNFTGKPTTDAERKSLNPERYRKYNKAKREREVQKVYDDADKRSSADEGSILANMVRAFNDD